MNPITRTSRRAGVVLLAVSSIFVGVMLGWALIAPDLIGRIPTILLVLVLGLLVLPSLTFGAIHMDRKAALRASVKKACIEHEPDDRERRAPRHRHAAARSATPQV